MRLILLSIGDLDEDAVESSVLVFHGTDIVLFVSVLPATNWNSNISQYGCLSARNNNPVAWMVEFFFAFIKAFLNCPFDGWVKFIKNGLNCSFDKYGFTWISKS